MSPKSRKRDQKIKKWRETSVYPVFFCVWPLYNTGDEIGSKAPQHVLKQAEMQPEIARVQSFGAKSGAIAAKPHASGGLGIKNFARKGPASPLSQQFKTHKT